MSLSFCFIVSKFPSGVGVNCVTSSVPFGVAVGVSAFLALFSSLGVCWSSSFTETSNGHSQIKILPEPLAETIYFPLGLNLITVMTAECPSPMLVVTPCWYFHSYKENNSTKF